MMKGSSSAAAVFGFLVGLTLGSWALIFPAFHARAAPADVCNDDLMNARDIGMFHKESQKRGIKADLPGLWVLDEDVFCELVSAVNIRIDGFDWVQFGWYENPGDFFPGDCGDTTGTPKRLANYSIDGTSFCVGSSFLIFGAPDWRKFRIANGDHDFDFDYFYEDALIGTTAPNMGFKHGWSMASTERTADLVMQPNPKFIFKYMYKQDSGGWALWPSSCLHDCGVGGLGGCEDKDPAYDAIKVSGNPYHLQVVSPSAWYDADCVGQ